VTAPRFLIDENLSPALADTARQRGLEAMHVNHLGLRTETDWELLRVVFEQDWVLVTNNAIEFRGRFGGMELHPGVIFLLPAVRRLEQIRLFTAVLDQISSNSDMVNRAIDVAFGLDGKAVVAFYDLP